MKTPTIDFPDNQPRNLSTRIPCKHCKFSIRVYLVLSLAFFVVSYPLLAQSNKCDPELQPANSTYGYLDRGNRCEGTYKMELGHTIDLNLKSFTTMLDYDLESSNNIPVEWPSYGLNDIYLRAYSLRHKTYYRLDTFCSIDTTFLWPSRILSRLRLQKNQIGVVGWTHARIGRSTKKIFLPLIVGHSKSPNISDKVYEIKFVSGAEIMSWSVSIFPVLSDGKLERQVYEDTSLGFYAANTPIYIRIPQMSNPGIYIMQVTAKSSVGAIGKPIYFYQG